MKSFLLLLALLLTYNGVWSQSCVAPQSLTQAQKEMVRGEWDGHYEIDATKRSFTVSIDFSNESSTVEISTPPLTGTVSHEEYRFCGAGAFHFKKELSNGSFEFDGVPKGDSMNGTLVVFTGKTEKTGRFFMTRKKQVYIRSN